MKIVNGVHRGETAKMLSIDEKTFSVGVKLESVCVIFDICWFTREAVFSLIGYSINLILFQMISDHSKSTINIINQ